MELKKNNSADLEKFRPLFLIIGLTISLALTAVAFNYKSETEPDTVFQPMQIPEIEEMEKITRQDIELPKPAPSQPQQQIVDEIIIKENDEIITDVVETDFGFSEEDIVDFTNTADDNDDETIFILAEYLPEYPGGHNALRSFISANIKYPRAAKDNKIQGTVYLRFEVKKTGKIGKIEIQKGVNPLLDEEAVRVVSLLPDFIPGSQNGKAVNVWYSLPIDFRLTN